VSELPDGWTEVPIGDLCLAVFDGPFGSNLKSIDYTESGVRVVRLENIGRLRFQGDRKTYISRRKYQALSKHALHENDILFSSFVDEDVRVCLVPKDLGLAINKADCFCLRINPRLAHPAFVTYRLASTQTYADMSERVHGATRPRVNLSQLRQYEISLPSVSEQKRIAAKINAVLARVEGCRARLDRVPAILKRFRHAVLEAAVSGRLTEDWRNASGQPQDWHRSTMGQAGSVSGGLTKNAKRAALSLRKPYLRVANVHANRLDLGDISTIGLTEVEWRKTALQAGDLLIVEGNGSLDQIGRVARWNGEIPECSHQNHLIRWRTHGTVSAKFGLLWLMSPPGRSALMDLASTSAGLYTLSISKVASVPIEVPSESEQAEIVRRVDELLALADALEMKYLTAVERVERLTPAVLAKAFRGELLPQDSNDEAAPVFLKRIKKQHTASGSRVVPDQIRAVQRASTKRAFHKMGMTTRGRR